MRRYDYRNVVLFPRKFDGRYIRLDRPHSEISPWAIWLSYSPDLVHWGDARLVMNPVKYHWDEMKIGLGATPFETEHGWLHIYHGYNEDHIYKCNRSPPSNLPPTSGGGFWLPSVDGGIEGGRG